MATTEQPDSSVFGEPVHEAACLLEALCPKQHYEARVTPAAISAPAERSRRVAFSSLAGVAQRFLQIAGVLIVMPMMLHALGAAKFGVWAAAASLSWMTVVVDFGVGQALLTSIAHNSARGDTREIRRQIAAALAISTALAALGAGLALAVIPALAPPEAAGAYEIAALCLGLNIPLNLTGNIWCGLQRFHMTSVWEAFQTIVTVGGLFALTQVSQDVRAYAALTAGALLLANVCSAIHLFLQRPDLRPALEWPSAQRCLKLMSRGAPLLVLSLAATLAFNLDSVLALSLLGPDAASQMAVAQRACLTAYGLIWVVTQPFWPAFTDAATRGDASWIRRHVLIGFAIVGLCATGGGAILVLFGQTLIGLWMHNEMTIGPDILWAMSAWIFLLSAGRIADVLLNALGATWFQARAAICYSGLAFALKFYFGPAFGVAGILASTALAYCLVYAPAYVWWVSRWMRTSQSAAPAAVARAI